MASGRLELELTVARFCLGEDVVGLLIRSGGLRFLIDINDFIPGCPLGVINFLVGILHRKKNVKRSGVLHREASDYQFWFLFFARISLVGCGVKLKVRRSGSG